MNRRTTRIGQTLIVLATLLGSSEASAQAPEADANAEAALQRGVALRKEQRDREALEEFRRAYALSASARARAQIALAEQALGQWIEAETDLAAALDAKSDAWIERNRPSLEAARAAVGRHLGMLEVSANVEGAELLLDGHAQGTLPHAPIRVAAGSVILDVRAAGHAPVRRIVEIPPSGVAREAITLVALAPIAEPGAGPTPAAPPAVPATRESSPEPAKSDGRRTWGIVSLGAAGAFLTVGVIGSIERVVYYNAYEDDPTCVAPENKSTFCVNQRDAVHRATVISIVGYSLAGVATVAGIWLLATSGPSQPKAVSAPSGAAPIRVSVAPMGLGAALRGDF